MADRFKKAKIFKTCLAAYDDGFDLNAPETGVRWKFVFSSLLLLFLVAGAPSFKISAFVRKDAPKEIPSQVSAGEFFAVANKGLWTSLSVNHTPFHKSESKKFFFAGVGLDDSADLLVEGVLKKIPSWLEETPFRHLYSSPVYYFQKIVKIQNALVSAELRGPASIEDKNLSAGLAARLNAEIADKIAKERKMVEDLMVRDDQEGSIECWRSPVASPILETFGMQKDDPEEDDSEVTHFHAGVDFKAAPGTPVKSPSSGEVVFSEELTNPGKMVVLYHGAGVYSRYMHLSELQAKVGEKVSSGQALALSGSSGRTPGAHLHFEVLYKGKLMNPSAFLSLSSQLCDGQIK